MESDFLTVKEAATRLRINVETMRRMVRSGKVPSLRVGKKHLIATKDMEQLLEQARHPKPAQP